MNFVDAAITLLEEAGRPVHVEELCRQAVERELLSRPGANPLRSMKGRLTSELNKGGESRIVKVEGDLWALPGSEAVEAEEADEADEAEEQVEADAADDAVVAPEEIDEAEVDESDEDLDDEDDDEEEEVAAAPLSPEERKLADLYADEADDTTPVAEISEYRDEHTADEDRAMLPEIRAERGRRRDRGGRSGERGARGGTAERGGDRPKGRRERRRRGAPKDRETNGQTAREGSEARERRPEREGRERRPERPSRDAEPAAARDDATLDLDLDLDLGNADALVLGAADVLRTAAQGQALPIRQLTQMMRKRHLVDGNPDNIWRLVRGVLVRDESQRRAAGLPPRVVHCGRDLFSIGSEAKGGALAEAEADLARAAEALAVAHRAYLKARLAQLSTKMLERIAHVYLHVAGWTEIEWIKRVDRSTYAVAVAPGAAGPTLISVRTGPEDVDRRGVGELRAGLVAKDIDVGLLVSPCELSDEAEVELGRGGKPIEILCGDILLDAFIQSGVGATQRTVTLTVTDEAFLHAVLG